MITECTIDVRYPDCDAMGIVHHAVYPVWYEIARMDFFEKMGFSYSDMHALGINPPMVDLHLKYAAPATYPGQVHIQTRMTQYAPKKLELSYTVFFEGAQIASATSFHIWTGPDMHALDMAAVHPDVYSRIESACEG